MCRQAAAQHRTGTTALYAVSWGCPAYTLCALSQVHSRGARWTAGLLCRHPPTCAPSISRRFQEWRARKAWHGILGRNRLSQQPPQTVTALGSDRLSDSLLCWHGVAWRGAVLQTVTACSAGVCMAMACLRRRCSTIDTASSMTPVWDGGRKSVGSVKQCEKKCGQKCKALPPASQCLEKKVKDCGY